MSKTYIIAIVSFFVIGLLLGTQFQGCKAKLGTKVVSFKTDTLIRWIPRTDTLYKTVELTNNIPYTVWGHDTVLVKHTEKISGHDTTWLNQYQAQSDTAAYADSIHQKDEFKAVILDTLFNNRIIGRQIKWADISPIEVKTVTNTTTLMKNPALVKVFVGAEAYGGKTGPKYNLDIAPAASIVINDGYMIDVGYYILNQQITAGCKIKLKFHK